MNKIDSSLRIAFRDCLNVKPHETVLIVSDDKRAALAHKFYAAAQQYAREALLIVMPERENNGAEPPAAVAEAMRLCDAAFLVTTKSLSHTQARKRASAAGARMASMPGITEDMILRALGADHQKMKQQCRRLIPKVSHARQVRITTAAGTDLTFSLKGRTARPDHGIIPERGGFTNLPAGEVYVAPLEGTANGVLVIDGSIADIWPMRKPITIAIAQGYAVGAGKGRDAARLWHILSRHGKPGLNVAEFGIGINPKARITGNILEDEKVLGTIHIAFGDNSNFGGRVRVPSHQDGIVRRPTVTVDGKTLIDHGNLLI